MKKYLVKGKSVIELLEKVAKHFKVEKDELDYEIIKEDKNFFGKIKEVEMRVWVSEKKDIKVKENNEVENNKEERIEALKYYEIKILKSGVYLKVENDFKKNGITDSMIIEELVRREIREPEITKVYSAMGENIGEFVKIAEYISDYYIDAGVQLTFKNSNMEVHVEFIEPQRGNDINYDQVMAELQLKGVIFGIKKEYMEKIIKDKIYNQQFRIVDGKLPINGNDAEMIFLFETELEYNANEDEKGVINFKEVHLIQNVEMRQALVKKIPLTQGEAGMNVFGEPVSPKPGKDKSFPKGKNTEVSESGEFLIASIPGHVSVVNKLVSVNPVYVVSENVDYSTGNIDFYGTVYVKGKILEGFEVKAKGDIIVEGVIEDAIVESEGNIKVKNGIIGKENGKGYIKALGSIRAEFIQNMRVSSEEDIEVKKHIMHSFVQARNRVLALEKDGKILGGEILAGKAVSAKVLGSKFGNATFIEVGVDPVLRKKHQQIKDELRETLNEREKLEADLLTLRKLKEENKLDEKKYKLFLEKTKMQFVLAKKIQTFKQEKDKIENMFEEIENGKINVLDTVYSGIIIKIGGHQLITKEAFRYVTFYIDSDRNEIGILPCEVG